MSADNNISVELTDANELYCFKLTFLAKRPELKGERVPFEILLHTRQAFDLFGKLGERLMDYFSAHSLDLLKRLNERDEQRRLLVGALHGLRSYQHGNSAPELAGTMADSIDRFLSTGEVQTIEGKAQSR